MAITPTPTFLNIAEANVEIARLSGELTKATQSLEALKGTHATELQTVKTELATEKQKATSLETEVATQKGLVAQRDEKIASLEKNAKSVETQAANVAAAAGQPAPIGAEGQAKDGKTLLEQYRELQGTNPHKAGEFWAKHSAEILK